MRLTVLLAGALLCVLLQPADARASHTSPHQGEVGCADPIMRPCGGALNFEGSVRHHPKRLKRFANRPESDDSSIAPPSRRGRVPPGLHRVIAEGAGRIVSHPAGCPRRAFCGCGAAVRIFGKPIRSLWLAAEWLRRFPRAQAARGMAAVRRDGHHIVVLEEHISGALWRVYDANSGRHRTRVHLRSIAGWTIVDPRAGA